MSVPEPQVLFRDAFADPAFGARWTLHDLATRQGPAQWSVRAGVLRQTANCYTPNSWRGTMLLARDTVEPPYKVTAIVRSDDGDRMGLAFGATSEEQAHLFWLSATLRSRTLSEVRGASERFLARDQPGYQLARWTELAVTVTADRILATVDGELALDVPAGRPLAGRAGLYAHANKGLEVRSFELARAIGASTEPVRVPWMVDDNQRRTVLSLSNVTREPVWVRMEALEQSGQPVRFSELQGLEGDGPWRRLAPRASALCRLGGASTPSGHGFVELSWRSQDPTMRRPLLVSARVEDAVGVGFALPVSG